MDQQLETIAARLEALGNPTRLRIYKALVRAGRPGVAVGGLAEHLDCAPSTLSHHVHRLLICGLLSQERKGTTLICRAEYQAMDGLIEYLSAECCSDVGGHQEATQNHQPASMRPVR